MEIFKILLVILAHILISAFVAFLIYGCLAFWYLSWNPVDFPKTARLIAIVIFSIIFECIEIKY